MEAFEKLLQALSEREAYSFDPGEVVLHQTHISAVFLAGKYAYKIKKPLDLGFLDFTTLEKRRHFCHEEVRLNKRLAPDVYLGVIPITLQSGHPHFGGEGEPIDYAVWMRRLPPDRTFESLLECGELNSDLLAKLASRIAKFHREAASGKHISKFGKWKTVAGNARENFDQTRDCIGLTVAPEVFEELESLTHEQLETHRALIDDRAKRNVPRDTHGDLHLDHVYNFPEEPPLGDLVIVDCIEFNERFRFADPIADIAFLAMDLGFHGRADLARKFADDYFKASGDDEGRALLPFYTSYRAVVRAKVEGFQLREHEIPEERKQLALRHARAYFLLAYKRLLPPARRPCLVLASGLPGSGKSTLARGLEERAGFARISSDETRKQLAGIVQTESAAADFGEGIYTSEWNDRTYEACLERARDLLFHGKRVVIDASFREESRRREFLELAREFALPALFFLCEAEPDEIKTRLAARTGDASDADWAIYQQAAQKWEPLSPSTESSTRRISTAGAPEDTVRRAIDALVTEILADG